MRRPSITRRSPSSSAASITSPNSSFREVPSLSDAMHFTTKSMKRLSLHGPKTPTSLGSHKSSSASSSPRASVEHINNMASLNFKIETPSMVCYGTQAESSGALLSGFLYLDVINENFDLQKLELFFQSVVTTKRPVVSSCAGCNSHTTNIETWTFVNDHVVAKHGEHSYPFSYHFPGHLPGTTDGMLASIKYKLHAVATTTSGETIQTTKDIKVQRALLADQERQSIRIFPPTDLSAKLTLPPVVHIGSEFPVEMRLEGLKNNEKNTRWKIRKMAWKVEEVNKVVSPACKVHSQKLGGDNKGIQHQETRVIAGCEIKSGWKNDFDCEKGKIEAEFRAGIPIHVKTPSDVTCAAGDISVAHILILEMIVSEEYVPKAPRMPSPTGAARVLRMQFNLPVSDRSGMGISWVDECPPLYADVPASPPTYKIDVLDLPPSFENSTDATQI